MFVCMMQGRTHNAAVYSYTCVLNTTKCVCMMQGRSLDQLLLFCHYIIFPGVMYLDKEEHARDFQAHVALFVSVCM